MKDIYDERHFSMGRDWIYTRTKDRRTYEEVNLVNYIEGWGAAVAVGVSVAATAASSYASASSKDAAANVAVPTYHPYTPTLAKENDFAGIQGLQSAYQQYGGAANQIAQGENNFYRQSINAIAPGTTQGLYLAGKNANQELAGQIPADVVAATNRASAQSALTGGFGSDSGQARNLNTRDLGLTSLNLTQMGASGLANNTRLAQSLTPYSAGDILGTSQQYLNNYNSYQTQNANAQTQAAKDNAQGFNQQAQQQYQQQVNQALAPNPYLAAGLSAASSASSAYLGYAGANGGSSGYGAGYGGANGNQYLAATPNGTGGYSYGYTSNPNG